MKPVRAPLHLICLVLNIVVPGTGTIISSFSYFRYVTLEEKAQNETKKPKFCDWAKMCDGLMQFVLTFFIIGWIWSIVVGCNLYNVSKEAF